MKHPILLRKLLAFPALVIAGIVCLTYREMQHEKQNTALIAAIKRDDAPAVIATLDAGADPNADDIDRKHVSFRQVLVDLWEKLQGRTSKANGEKNERFTALMLAAHPQLPTIGSSFVGVKVYPTHPAIIKALLTRGANPNVVKRVQSVEYGGWIFPETALCIAAANDDIVTVRSLLASGANVNLRDKSDMSPLGQAVSHGYYDVVSVLLEHGANPNAVDDNGETELTSAVEQGDIKAVEVLLKVGANVNAKNSSGQTALKIFLDMIRDHQIESNYSKELVAILKKAGAKE